jgi:hypothetical protein
LIFFHLCFFCNENDLFCYVLSISFCISNLSLSDITFFVWNSHNINWPF